MWLRFEATRENNYVKPIMEGAERIEVNPLLYILMVNSIREEVQRWLGVGTTTIDWGDFSLSEEKTT